MHAACKLCRDAQGPIIGVNKGAATFPIARRKGEGVVARIVREIFSRAFGKRTLYRRLRGIAYIYHSISDAGCCLLVSICNIAGWVDGIGKFGIAKQLYVCCGT